MPEVVQFKDGHQIINQYDASGKKLSSRYYTVLMKSEVPVVNTLQVGQVLNLEYNMDIIDETGTYYVDNFEYGFNGCDPGVYWLEKAYNQEGYTINTDNPEYYYYRKDHLGNNREVWCANSGYTVQRTQYYPTGLPWMDGTGKEVQNKKYNGKEFVETHGLEEYDSEARWMYPAIMRTTTLDPLAEKYYSISPYAWCGNNPVRMVDPTGKSGEEVINKKNKTITITSKLYFYGSKANSELSKKIATGIVSQWNGANATKTINGVKYKVKFSISYETVSEDKAKSLAKNNTSLRNNFIRVEDGKQGQSSFTLTSNKGGNSFWFNTDDELGSSTTVAHEYGHGLGLVHPNKDLSKNKTRHNGIKRNSLWTILVNKR